MASALPTSPPSSAAGSSPFLNLLKQSALQHGHPETAAESLVTWCRQFIMFHDKRHPQEMGLAEATVFLQHVAKTEKDPLKAIDQARAALVFLYESLMQRSLGELPWPQPPRLLDQVRQFMAEMGTSYFFETSWPRKTGKSTVSPFPPSRQNLPCFEGAKSENLLKQLVIEQRVEMLQTQIEWLLSNKHRAVWGTMSRDMRS